MDLSHIFNELGEDRESYFGAVAPPIIQTSNFAFKNVAQLREAMRDEFAVDLYSRGNNPTVSILRKKIAALDHAEDALVLSSGVAAVFLAVFANVKQGDHIVSVAKPYSWTDKLFNVLLPRFGVTATMIDGTNIENFERAIQPNTKIIFLESPNSFTFELQDLEAVARLAKSKQLLTIIDNSYCGDNDEWKYPAIALRDTEILKGDRICQFRIVKKQPNITFEEVEHLEDNDRGGFGSTGKR